VGLLDLVASLELNVLVELFVIPQIIRNLSDFERFKVLRLRKQVRRNIGRGIRSGIMRLGSER
jgi:hypothetical protein